MRISSAYIFQQGVQRMLEQQARLLETQQQIATGQRILTPADDPTGAKRLLDLDQALGLTRQYLRNADVATNRLAIEDSTLDAAGNLLQRVRELAVQGNNDTLTDGDRRALALEVGERLDELLGLANTKDGNGEYLFAGMSTQTRPFARALGGGFVYNGDQGQREILIAPGYMVPVGDSGSAAFMEVLNGNGTFATADDPGNTGTGIIDAGTVTDPSAWVPDTYTITFVTATSYEVRDGGGGLVLAGAYTSDAAIAFNGVEVSIGGAPVAGDAFTVSASTNQDIFTTVQNLVNALNSPGGTDPAAARFHNAMNRALADLDQGIGNLLEIRARVGSRLNAVDSESAVNEGSEIYLQELHSQVQDLDLAEAISRLTQQAGALEAAQASFARIQTLSLFNFI